LTVEERSRTEEFVGLHPGDTVAFIGGGGKSMLMDSIGRRLVKDGRKVLLAGTRSFRLPEVEAPPVFLTGEQPLGNLAPILGEHGLVVIAPERGPDGELSAYAPGALAPFRRMADYLFVECEDAGGESLPEPRLDRKVPPGTKVMMMVAGIDALGPEIDTAEFARRLTVPGGVLRCRPGIDRRVLALNKADRKSMRADAARVGGRALDMLDANYPRPKVILTSVRDYLRPIG
jgi:hypothetical protein